MTAGYSTTHRNARLDALTSALGNACLIRFYDGTRPSTGGAATTLLATLTGGTPFAPAAAAGVLTANAITGGVAGATGTATWARLLTSAAVFVADVSVTVAGGGGDIQLTGTALITSGLTVNISSLIITEGNA